MRWTPWLDRIGATVSAVCGVHCAAFSAYLLLNPLIWFQRGRYASQIAWLTWLEIALAALAVLFAALAFGLGWHRHRRLLPCAIAVPALAMILAGVFSPLHDVLFLGVGTVLAGGLLMVVAHWLNARTARRHHGCGGIIPP